MNATATPLLSAGLRTQATLRAKLKAAGIIRTERDDCPVCAAQREAETK